MFIPSASTCTPTGLQREAETKKGIKKPLFYALLWLWSVFNKGSDMESLLGTNSRGYTRYSYMNLWVHPNEGVLDLNSARPGLKCPCVPTISVINLRIKHSWPFMFHSPWIKTWEQTEEQGRRQKARQRERDGGWLKVKSRLVLVQSSASPRLSIHIYVLVFQQVRITPCSSFLRQWQLQQHLDSARYNCR